MRPKQSPAVGQLLRFAALAVAVSAIMIAVGYFPTKRLGGADAVVAMLAGCAISLVASVVGALPIVGASRAPGGAVVQAVLLSTGVRLMVVLVLALSAALSGWLERTPLLIWVAISYLFMLIVDTVYAVRFIGSAEGTEKE